MRLMILLLCGCSASPPDLSLSRDPIPPPSNVGVDVQLVDGGRWRSSDYEGKPILLSFWASWCGPCIAEVPKERDLYATYGGRIGFLGVNEDGQELTARTAIRRNKITWPQAWDYGHVIRNRFNVQAYPTFVLIDKHGTATTYVGGGQDLDALIRKATQ